MSATSLQYIWFCHISGLPYLWSTLPLTGWSVPAGWSHQTGLLLLPGKTIETSASVDPLGGVASAGSIELAVYGSAFRGLTKKSRSRAESSPITTNNVAHGSEGSWSTEWEMTDAPAGGGTVYLGGQAITYTGRTGTSFSGTDRGRYHSLDADLAEVKWKPAVKWISELATPPVLTIYPQQLEGRVLTLYRVAVDAATGEPEPKQNATVRWRGPIESEGMTEDSLGTQLSVLSVLDLLESDACHDMPETPLSGYILRDGWIHVKEEPTHTTGTYRKNGTVTGKVDPSEIREAAGPDELVALVQKEFDRLWNGSYMYAHWKIERGEDGRVVLYPEPRGLYVTGGNTWAGIPTNSTEVATPFEAYVGGQICLDPVLQALGFEGDLGSWLRVPVGSEGEAKSNFAHRTNASDPTWSGWIDGPYAPPKLIADNPPALSYADLRRPTAVPVENNADFEWTVGDGGNTYAWVPGVGAVPVAESTDTGALGLSGKVAPLGRKALKPTDLVINVNEESDTEERVVTQAWVPTCEHEVSYGVSQGTRIGYSLQAETHSKKVVGVEHMLLQLLLSTGSSEENTSWDILPEGFGMAIPSAFVDTDSFAALGDLFPGTALRRKYIFHEPVKMRDLLQSECRTLGFDVVMVAGKITAIVQVEPTYLASELTIDDSVRISDGELEWQSSPEGLYNMLIFHADYDHLEDEYYWEDKHLDYSSVVDSERLESTAVRNKGIRSEIWGGAKDVATEIRLLQQGRLGKLARPSYLYRAEINPGAFGLELGDVVMVTDSRVHNPEDGSLGIENQLGVVEALEVDDAASRGFITVRIRYDFDYEYEPQDSPPYRPVNTGSTGTSGEVQQHSKKVQDISGAFQWGTSGDPEPPSASSISAQQPMKIEDPVLGTSKRVTAVSYANGQVTLRGYSGEATGPEPPIIKVDDHDRQLSPDSGQNSASALAASYVSSAAKSLSGKIGYKY